MEDVVCSNATPTAVLPRCGRCVWWMGRRFRNANDKTVSFTVNGLCSNTDAPPNLAGRQVHYLDGANCPRFKHWKEE